MRGPLQKGYAELAINKSSTSTPPTHIPPAAATTTETKDHVALSPPTSGVTQKYHYSPKLRHLLRLDSPCEGSEKSAIDDEIYGDKESPFCRDDGLCHGNVNVCGGSDGDGGNGDHKHTGRNNEDRSVSYDDDDDAESAVSQPGRKQKG